MPSIRIREWTKDRLEEVRDVEAHSSYDSVVKSLLRDRELARATVESAPNEGLIDREQQENPDKQFSDITALAEVTSAREGIMFLWCPNCGNEVAHLVADNTVTMSVFEIQCQQCLTELNQHAIVTVEIGYPVEKKVVNNALQSDLRTCIIDYWDRTLADIGTNAVGDDVDEEYLIWQIFKYYTTFDWNWPEETPAVGLKTGETYLNRNTDEYLAVVEKVTDHQEEYGPMHVETWNSKASRQQATEQLLEPDEIRHLITNRVLYPVKE